LEDLVHRRIDALLRAIGGKQCEDRRRQVGPPAPNARSARVESLVSAEMVAVATEMWASLTSTDIPSLARAQHGKPVLVPGDERRADLTVSIAHDSSSVGVAFSFRRSIGLDVESCERVIPSTAQLLLTSASSGFREQARGRRAQRFRSR